MLLPVLLMHQLPGCAHCRHVNQPVRHVSGPWQLQSELLVARTRQNKKTAILGIKTTINQPTEYKTNLDFIK